jgi:hypothetical protein
MNLDDAKDVVIFPAIIQGLAAFSIVWYFDASGITNFFAHSPWHDKLHLLTFLSSVLCQCVYQFFLLYKYGKGEKLSLTTAIMLGAVAPLFPVAGLTILLWRLLPSDWDRLLGVIPAFGYLTIFLMSMRTLHILTQTKPEERSDNSMINSQL